MYEAGAAVGRWPYLLSRKDKLPSPRDFTSQSPEVKSVDRPFRYVVNFTRRRDDVSIRVDSQKVFLTSSMTVSVIKLPTLLKLCVSFVFFSFASRIPLPKLPSLAGNRHSDSRFSRSY